MAWLKLNENELVTGTDTGIAPSAAVLTFPLVLTQTMPQVTSKTFVPGRTVDCPTIRITTLAEVLRELATIAVQLCMPPLLVRLRWWVQWSFPAVKATDGVTVTVTLSEWAMVPLVPVIVTMKLIGVATFAKMASDVLELPAVGTITGFGVNITVIPVGTLLLDSVTLPVKVLMLATVITSEPDPPAGIDRDEAAAAMLKSAGTGEIVRSAQVPVNRLLLVSPLYDAW